MIEIHDPTGAQPYDEYLRNYVNGENNVALTGTIRDTFHIFEVQWQSNSNPRVSNAYIDHLFNVTASNTAQVPINAFPITLYSYGTGSSLQVDWVYVRQYRNPEPMTTVPVRDPDIQETVQVSGTGALTFAWVNVDPVFGLTVDTMDTLTSVQVVRYPIHHPHANGCPPSPGGVCQATLKYWELHATGAGYSLSLTLPWTTPDDQDKICFWTGSGQDWDCTMTSYGNPANTITRSGITELSDWAVGSNYAPTAITLEGFTASSSNNWALPALVGSGLFGCFLGLSLLISRKRKKTQ